MNHVEIVRKLAAAAEKERIPEVDVSRSVLASLHTQEEDLARPLAWVAVLSVLAAPAAVFLAFEALEAWNDPLRILFSSFTWMMS
jgi:hypothetical protein